MGTKQQLATNIKQLSDVRKSNSQQLDSLRAYTQLGNLIKKSIGSKGKENSAKKFLSALDEGGKNKDLNSHLETIFNAINAQRKTKIADPNDNTEYANIVNAKFIATMGDSYVKSQAAAAKKAKKAKPAPTPKRASAPKIATTTEFSNISWPGSKTLLINLNTAVESKNFISIGDCLGVGIKKSKDMNTALAQMFANKVQDLIDTEGNTYTDFATAWEYLLKVDQDASSSPLAKTDPESGAQTPLGSLIGAAERLKGNVQQLIKAKNKQAAPKKSQGGTAPSGAHTQSPNEPQYASVAEVSTSGAEDDPYGGVIYVRGNDGEPEYASADEVIASGGSSAPDASRGTSATVASGGSSKPDAGGGSNAPADVIYAQPHKPGTVATSGGGPKAASGGDPKAKKSVADTGNVARLQQQMAAQVAAQVAKVNPKATKSSRQDEWFGSKPDFLNLVDVDEDAQNTDNQDEPTTPKPGGGGGGGRR